MCNSTEMSPKRELADSTDRIHARIVYSEQGNIAAIAWRGGVVSYYCPREDVRVVVKDTAPSSHPR